MPWLATTAGLASRLKASQAGAVAADEHLQRSPPATRWVNVVRMWCLAVVGGVLLVQERAQARVKNESIYGDWYSKAQAGDPAQTPASTEPFGIALTPNASAVDLGIIQGSETAPFLVAQAELQRAELMKAFTYSPEHQGYAHFFLSTGGRDAHLGRWFIVAGRGFAPPVLLPRCRLQNHPFR